MKIITNCVICGAPLDNPTTYKHYCPDCLSDLTSEWMRHAAERLKRDSPKKPCVRCGTMIEGYPPNKRYCTECAIEVRREKNRIQKNAPEKCKSPSGNLVKKNPYELHRKKPASPAFSINQVQAKADQLGISYGQCALLIQQGKVKP